MLKEKRGRIVALIIAGVLFFIVWGLIYLGKNKQHEIKPLSAHPVAVYSGGVSSTPLGVGTYNSAE